ncbi:iron-sulfur protein [Streptomyces sp. SL13]|uniref:Iron-sulfur protein n=1 Tax=Streptantibioticus silvisoli TaxID=2705255 RepID=A0AA90GY99_9ACTN|nr:iron-sulfur protein [Streptantibioticus silvisoli]MDI5969999.1 iron-sulfur protein [Streptantibioticus silvisoli]
MNGSGALDALIEGESERVAAAYGRRPRRDVAASRFLHHYLWSVGLLFTGPWYLAGRVPRVPLDRLTADPATGAFTLDARGLECGPNGDGPGGDGPGGNEPEVVRDAVAEHVGPVLEAFGPRVRRGPRALWGMATDDLASGLWFLGRARGEEERGIRAATALLPGGTAPFPGAAAFRVLRGPSGTPHPTRTRLGCCLYYAITPDEPCLTCPRVTDGERLRRLERS